MVYVTYMKSKTSLLAMPPDLLLEVRRVAAETGISMADAMRQSIKIGLPELRERLMVETAPKPFTKEESRLTFQPPNPEFDDIERHCGRMRFSPSEVQE